METPNILVLSCSENCLQRIVILLLQPIKDIASATTCFLHYGLVESRSSLSHCVWILTSMHGHKRTGRGGKAVDEQEAVVVEIR